MRSVFEEKEEGRDASLLRRISYAIAPLGVLAFWCCMVISARRYPSGYDWRYLSVSKLVYPERNPAGYLWAVAGIVLCSTCGLYWVHGLARRRNHAGTGYRPRGTRALQMGYLFMLCAVLPDWLLRIEKAHEILAALAFAGLLIGMVRLMFQTSENILLSRIRRPRSQARAYAFIVASVAVLPIVLAGLAQAYFYYVPEKFRWGGFSWSVQGWPVLLRFPFWEWITCIVLSVYMAGLSLATHGGQQTRKSGE